MNTPAAKTHENKSKANANNFAGKKSNGKGVHFEDNRPGMAAQNGLQDFVNKDRSPMQMTAVSPGGHYSQPPVKQESAEKKTAGVKAGFGKDAPIQRVVTTSGNPTDDATAALEQLKNILKNSGGLAGELYGYAQKDNGFDLEFCFMKKPFGELNDQGISPHGGTVVYETGAEKNIIKHDFTAMEVQRISAAGIKIVIFIYMPAHDSIGKYLSTMVHEIGVHATTWWPMIQGIFASDPGTDRSDEDREKSNRIAQEVAAELTNSLREKSNADHLVHGKEEHNEYNLLKDEMLASLYLWSYYPPWSNVYADFKQDVERDIDEHRVKYAHLPPKYTAEFINAHKEVENALSLPSHMLENAKLLSAGVAKWKTASASSSSSSSGSYYHDEDEEKGGSMV